MMRISLFLPLFYILWHATAIAQSPALVLQKGHFKKINSISFSKNGRQIVTTSDDGIIKIWDAFSQKLVTELGGNGMAYLNATFSPAGNYIIANAEPPGEGGEFGPSRETYNNQQYYMLYNNTPVYIWDTETGQLVYFTKSNYETHKISPDAEFAAIHPNKTIKTDSASRKQSIIDAPVSIYHVATGKLFREIKRFEDSTTDNEPFLEFISDSTLLTGIQTMAPGQKMVVTKFSIFNFITNTVITSFTDTGTIKKKGSLVLSPGRNYFLRYNEEMHLSFDTVNNYNAYTELWDIHKQKMIWKKEIRLRNFGFSSNDSVLWLVHESSESKYTLEIPYTRSIIHLSMQEPGRAYEVKAGYTGDVSASNSPAQNCFAVGAMEEQQVELPIPYKDTVCMIHVWDTLHTVKCTYASKKAVTAMAFGLDEKMLVTGYADGNFSILDIGDSLGKEIAGSGNIIDPVIQVHADKTTKKVFYITKSIYGFQDENTINKLSYFTGEKLPFKDVQYVLKGKYSILSVGEKYKTPGKFLIVNNDSPAVVKEYSYGQSDGSLPVFHDDGNEVDLFTKPKWTTKLHYPKLESFSIYGQMVSYDNPRRHMMRPDILLTYGILKSSAGTDTSLISSSLDAIRYNDQLKGYIFTYEIPYYIRKSTLMAVSPVFPKAGSSFLTAPVISNDGRYLMGRDGFDNEGIISPYYFCQDLKSNTVFKTPVLFQGDSLGIVSQFTISPNGASACILSDPALSWGAHFVRVVNARNGSPLYNLKVNNGGSVTGVEYTKDSRFVYTWSEGGACTKWDLGSGVEIYTLVFFQDHDYAIILPDGYYYISSRTDARYLNFKLNNRLYNFSQFDLQFNRPDKVLQAIGSRDKSLIDEYYKAWLGRVKKSGFAETDFSNNRLHVPELNLRADDIPPYTSAQELTLSFTVTDSLFHIKSYNIFINDIPVNGINGRPMDQPAHSSVISQAVLLSEGMNKIEVSCTNENATVSRKEAVYITYSPLKHVPAKTYFIGIGINRYSQHSSFVDLSYCVKDIRDLGIACKEKFGDNMVIDTLMNDEASRENILALKQKLMQTGVDDKVIVSFSGHGMVDPLHPGDFYFVTGNTDVNNPAENGVSYAQLEELLNSIPSRKKLLLLDACHSGESADNAGSLSNHIPGTKRGNDDYTRNKAGSIEILDVVENNGTAQASTTDIFKLMKEAFVDIRRNNGAYVLSAAQSNESAGEGGGISNGWFSSCLIEQLKQHSGMSVNDLSTKVNHCVSEKSGGNQNTDNRQELAEFNWQLW